MRINSKWWWGAILGGLGLSGTALADPLEVTHSGRLLSGSDEPVQGIVRLSFRLYDTPVGGNLAWAGTDCDVELRNGHYAVILGRAGPGGCGTGLTTQLWTPIGVRYLEVSIAGVTLLPRQPLTPVPAAAVAGRALVAEALSSTALTTLDARYAALDATGKVPLSLLPTQIPDPARLGVTAFQSFAGPIAAPEFSGGGAGLTNLDAGRLSLGTLPDARLSGTYSQPIVLSNTANVLRGTVVLGSTGTEVAGSVRFVGGHFQGYDGTRWVNLDNIPPPTISSLSPDWGVTGAPTTLNVVGSNFQPLATVRVGDAVCTVSSATDTVLVATCPASIAAGTHDLRVTNPDGQAITRAGGFTQVQAPVISGVSPAEGIRTGGTVVTLTGSGFVSGMSVQFGSSAASSVTVTSATQLTAVVPPGTPGATTITVSTPAPRVVSASSTYTYRRFGESGTVAAASCLAIKNAGDAGSDGQYWLDLDGPGSAAPIQVWCDMTTDGGGWTLVRVSNGTTSPDLRTESAVNPQNLTSPSANVNAQMSSATLNALGTVLMAVNTASSAETRIWYDRMRACAPASTSVFYQRNSAVGSSSSCPSASSVAPPSQNRWGLDVGGGGTHINMDNLHALCFGSWSTNTRGHICLNRNDLDWWNYGSDGPSNNNGNARTALYVR